MILIAGIPSEGPTRLVIDAAESAGIPHVVFDQHKAHSYEFSIRCLKNSITASMRIDGTDYELDEFQGVFLRIMEFDTLPERKPGNLRYEGKDAAEKSGLIHQYLLHWLDIAPCRVMNRPRHGLSNMSKPYQAQLIAGCGLKVPATCVTNDPASVMEFKRQRGDVIFKSVSSVRSIVKPLDGVDMLQMDRIRYLPTQFQQQLRGFNIRVHVAGDQLFATKADTGVVDYRYAGREGGSLELSPIELPQQVQTACFAVSATLKLPLCGIDLFLTEGGEYYCFEANPSPGYSFFQEATGQDIAGAIVSWLDKGTSS